MTSRRQGPTGKEGQRLQFGGRSRLPTPMCTRCRPCAQTLPPLSPTPGRDSRPHLLPSQALDCGRPACLPPHAAVTGRRPAPHSAHVLSPPASLQGPRAVRAGEQEGLDSAAPKSAGRVPLKTTLKQRHRRWLQTAATQTRPSRRRMRFRERATWSRVKGCVPHLNYGACRADSQGSSPAPRHPKATVP